MKRPKRPAPRKAARRGRKPIMRHDREGVKPRPKRAARRGSPRKPASELKRQYLDAFRREFPTTLKVLKAYPSGKDDFKPHDRSHSAARLAHTFAVENAVQVHARPPYAAKGRRDRRNKADELFARGGSRLLLAASRNARGCSATFEIAIENG